MTPTGQPQANEDTELTKAIKLLTSGWIFNGTDVQIIGHRFYGRVSYLTKNELENYLEQTDIRLKEII